MPSQERGIAFLGDWGRRGSPGQRIVADSLARVADEVALTAVVTTGDNFYEEGVASEYDDHWRESFEDVYGTPALQVPWYASLGNHDHLGVAGAQVAYSRKSSRWNLPAFYYSRIFGIGATTVQLVVLDTTAFLRRHAPGGPFPIPGVDGRSWRNQITWLRRTLATSRADWILVVGHHPARSGSPFHGPDEEVANALEPLFEDHRVTAYVSGHEHDLQHLIHGDVHHFVSGAGAEVRETGFAEDSIFAASELGFLLAVVDAERLEFRFVGPGGTVLYEAATGRNRRFALRS